MQFLFVMRPALQWRFVALVVMTLLPCALSGCFGHSSGSKPKSSADPANDNPVIQTTALPDAEIQQSYLETIQVTGGTPPYTFVASGNLPPGIASGTTGVVGGTPTTLGPFSFVLSVFDKNGKSDTRTLTLVVINGSGGGGGGAGPDIDSDVLSQALAGSAYLFSLSASGGTPPYTWSGGAGLPTGLSLNAQGQVLGFAGTAGVYVFNATVQDALGLTTTKALTITVLGSTTNLQVTSTNLGSATIGAPFFGQLLANGGIPPFTWTTDANLPPGLSVDAAGSIGGTPNTLGNFVFVATVTDSTNFSANANVLLSVVVPALADDSEIGIGPVQEAGFVPLESSPASYGVGRLKLCFDAPLPCGSSLHFSVALLSNSTQVLGCEAYGGKLTELFRSEDKEESISHYGITCDGVAGDRDQIGLEFLLTSDSESEVALRLFDLRIIDEDGEWRELAETFALVPLHLD